MKKIFLIFMIISLIMIFAVSASASFGTVVEAQKVSEQPNLVYIDKTWGDPVVTNITSATENTYLWHYWSTWADTAQFTHGGTGPNGRTTFNPEDNPIDLYLAWDEDYFYFAIKAVDYDIHGHSHGHHGDGVQLWFQPADSVSDPTVGATKNEGHAGYNPFWYCWTLAFDDWSTSLGIYDPKYIGIQTAAQELEIQPIVNVDPSQVGDDCFDAIIAIPWSNFYPRKTDKQAAIHDGAEFAIAFMRVSSTSETRTSTSGNVHDDDGYSGGLCWGKYLAPNPPQYDTPTNTSLNTVVLRDPNADPAESDQTADTEGTNANTAPSANLSGVSGWALTEVTAAIEEGLIPEYIQKDWTSPITRGQVSEMFIRLLEKATGKSVDAIIAEKGATIEEGKFEDTNDANVYAANALGIINGTSSSKFSPNGTLKRAQIAALINRVAKVVGIETGGYTHSFEDITDNYAWVNAELGWPSTVGIINGVSSTRFNPGGDLTTEQAILITYRALNALKK